MVAEHGGDPQSLSGRALADSEWDAGRSMASPEGASCGQARREDPNGNGKADEIPLVGAIPGWHAKPHLFLLNSFVNWSDTRYGFYVKDGTVTAAFTEPAYRDGLRYLHELHEEGLLDPVSFTQDVNQMKQLINSDPFIVGVWPNGLSPGFLYGEEAGVLNYVHLDPLEGPGGVRLAQFNPYALIATGLAGITTESKYPRVATRWMDQFFDEEVATISRFGIKDKHWRYLNEGEVALTSEKIPAGDRDLDADWDSYLEELETIGLERMIEIQQSAIR